MTEKCSHTFILMAMHTASSQKLLVITVVVRIPATADFFSFITLLLMQKKKTIFLFLKTYGQCQISLEVSQCYQKSDRTLISRGTSVGTPSFFIFFCTSYFFSSLTTKAEQKLSAIETYYAIWIWSMFWWQSKKWDSIHELEDAQFSTLISQSM